MTAAVGTAHPTQIDGANLLTLMVVDDDHAIRKACMEVAQSMVSIPALRTRPNTLTPYWILKMSTWCCSTWNCLVGEAWISCLKFANDARMPW
jgi:hypothetical protein